MARLVDLNAQVIGVAVTNPFSNKAFAEKNRLPFPVLRDYTREVIKQWNLVFPDFAGLKDCTVAKRSIFILDERGIVRYIWISENPLLNQNTMKYKKPWSKYHRLYLFFKPLTH